MKPKKIWPKLDINQTLVNFNQALVNLVKLE